MFLILDKDLSTERSVQINDVYENISAGGRSLSAVYRVKIPSEDPIQPVADLPGTRFRTLDIEDAEGHEIPVQGTYNIVQAVTCTFNEASSEYSVNIAIGYLTDD